MKKARHILLGFLLTASSAAQAQFHYETVSINSANPANVNNFEQVNFSPTFSGTATISYQVSVDPFQGTAGVSVGSNSFFLFTAEAILTPEYAFYPETLFETSGSPSFQVTGGATYSLSGQGTISNPLDMNQYPVGLGLFQATVSYPVFDYICSTNGGKITIERYIGHDSAVAIPSTVNGLPVVSIGMGAFNGLTNVTGVTIPDTVTSIQDYAFAVSGLTGVAIPDSVTSIGAGAFDNCTNATSVTIPDSVTSIGIFAFSGSGVTNVVIPESVTSIADYTFYFCENLTGVTFPNSVTSIGAYAFAFSGLTNIALPNSVTSITSNVFYACESLSGVVIPNTVTSIGDFAFSDCTALSNITIPNSVTGLGNGVFSISGLTSITIPSGITHAGTGIFAGCQMLANVTLPNTATGIPAGTFSSCPSLHTITIPDSVTSIGTSAFYDSGLYSINIPNSVTTIGDDTFFECTGLGSVSIGTNVGSIGISAFGYCGVNSIVIPASVYEIGENAFENCGYLQGAFFEGNAPYDDSTAFTGDHAATAYYLPGTSGWNSSFGGIPTALWVPSVIFTYTTNNGTITITGYKGPAGPLTIPNSINGLPVTGIGASAFIGNNNVTTVTIPNTVTSIGATAFFDDENLTKIVVPASVISVGQDAVAFCSNLTAAYFLGNAPAADGPVIYGDPVTLYYLPGTTGWDGLPAVLWNPTIQTANATFGVRTAGFGFNITGTANIPIAVEACSDPANPIWTSLLTGTLTNGSIYFSDFAWTNHPSRFYRISAP
jgi:hypothetical protein